MPSAAPPARSWPEYNQHGQTLNHYWDQLYEVFPEWQFARYDPGEERVLARDTPSRSPGTAPTPASGQASTRPSRPASNCRQQGEAHRGQCPGRRDTAKAPGPAPLRRSAQGNVAPGAPRRAESPDRTPCGRATRTAIPFPSNGTPAGPVPTDRRSSRGSGCTPGWVPGSGPRSRTRCISPARRGVGILDSHAST